MGLCWRRYLPWNYDDMQIFLLVLAPGGISHSGPGGNRQLWPDENSQS